MRFRYYFVVQDLAGNVVGNANVSVYLADSNVPAIVYPTNTSPTGVRTVPQLVSSPDGSVVFWLDSDDYSYGQLFDIVVQKDSFGFRLEDVQIIVWDAVNADRLDGFHASRTPAPNVIVPLDANGILDLSATYVKSDVYTFRRVDLTNATSDYMLRVGEEAIVRFNNQQLIPLRVAVEEPSTPLNPVIYNINICVYWASASSADLDFFPNNTTYSNQIQELIYFHSDNGWSGWNRILDKFWIDFYGGTDNFPCFANLFVLYYGAQQPKLLYGIGFSYLSVTLCTCMWNNTTTAWTSLGSFRFYSGSARNISGITLVRRLA